MHDTCLSEEIEGINTVKVAGERFTTLLGRFMTLPVQHFIEHLNIMKFCNIVGTCPTDTSVYKVIMYFNTVLRPKPILFTEV